MSLNEEPRGVHTLESRYGMREAYSFGIRCSPSKSFPNYPTCGYSDAVAVECFRVVNEWEMGMGFASETRTRKRASKPRVS